MTSAHKCINKKKVFSHETIHRNEMNVSAKHLKSFAAGKSAEYMNFYRHLSNNSKFTIEKREEPRNIFHLIEPLIEIFKQFFHISIRHFFSPFHSIPFCGCKAFINFC